MHRVTPPQSELEHLTVKSTLYTLNNHPWGPNFGPFRSTANSFQDIWHILSFPIDYHAKRPKKNRKKIAKNPKFEISQFFEQLW